MVTKMVTRKKLSILVVVSIICSLLFIPAGYSNAGSTAATISGSVSLPGGMTAPAGGINVTITPIDVQYSIYISDTVLISEGGTTANYTVSVPANSAGAPGYKIKYQIDAISTVYVQVGYYSSGGTTANYSNASLVDVSAGNASDINLTLIEGHTISGNLSLPGGLTAPAGGLQGGISIYSQSGEGYWINFNIPEGSTGADYSITVPINAAGSGYTVYYWLSTASSVYVQYGYYSIEGMTANYNNASLVDVSAGNASDINLILIQGHAISGNISLPGGMTAPAGGLQGYIYSFLQSEGYYYSAYFYIAAGSTGADYSVTVPINTAGTGYAVHYWLSTASIDYAQQGYYSIGGTTPSVSSATLVDVSAGNASDINLTLIEGRTISGRISLPGGMTAPAGGLYGEIHGFLQSGEAYWTTSHISEGSTGADYSINVPANAAGSGYTVRYMLSTSSNVYVERGFYSIGGTTANYSGASLVDVSVGNASDINLTLIEGRTISGRISLPGGMTAPAGGLYGEIYSLGGEAAYWIASHIPEGSTGADYSVTVPENAAGSGYTVFYRLSTASNVYVQQGFYSSGGTTASYNNATLVDVSAGNESNINMEIILAITSTSCVFEGALARGIIPGTLIEGLTSGIQTPNGYTVKIVNNDGSEPPAGSKIGTGMKVQVLSGTSAIKEYTIIIYGDTTGDGNINVLDLLGVKRCILGLQTLTGAYATAANTNHDTGGEINVLDLLKIKRDILGLEVIVQ